MLTRNEILQKRPLKTLTVSIPDWQGEIIMRQLSARQVLEIQKAEEDRATFVQLIALYSIVDENGKPIFQAEDKDWLADQPVSVYTAIVQGFLKVNGLTEEAIEDQKKS